MNKKIDIISTIPELQKKAERFKVCFGYLLEEEGGNNNEIVIKAWRVILDDFIVDMNSTLMNLKGEIQWSLIDDQSKSISEFKSNYGSVIDSYKEYVNDDIRKTIISIISLLDEGANGFRQSMIEEGYYEKLFNFHYNNYRKGNESRLELIYNQDFNDLMDNLHGDTLCKKQMVDKRREELFKDKYGMIYHDKCRDIKLVTFSIIESNEKNEVAILSFIDKYLAYNIAIEKRDKKEENTESKYENIIFKENVDIDKVISKLHEYIEKGVIKAKRHWYIVYRVFLKKDWLIKDNQRKFRDQINSVVEDRLKCTKNDFSKLGAYILNKNIYYLDWSLEDNNAPQNCNDLKKMAKTFHDEFTDEKYAKPGKVINTWITRKS